MCMPTNFGGKKDKSYKIREVKKQKSDFDDDFFNDDSFFEDDNSNEDKKIDETSNIKS